MKKRLFLLTFLAFWLFSLLCPAWAAGDGKMRQYIIPDSDSRSLTEEELWSWDYESIGYIFNEIFARHGYCFEAGGKYDNYFRSRPWYTPNANPDNSRACYPQLNAVEWSNEKLCKEVRASMRALHTSNRQGKHYLDYVTTDAFDVLSGFRYTNLKAGQKLAVYSAPSAQSWRGAGGKASVSTNGSVYVAGWESGWLLLMYETNHGAVRVGYVQKVKGKVDAPRLQFLYAKRSLLEEADLTDDPATESSVICRLRAGDVITYLTSFQNHRDWAYVETMCDGRKVRGFLPMTSLSEGEELAENEAES